MVLTGRIQLIQSQPPCKAARQPSQRQMRPRHDLTTLKARHRAQLPSPIWRRSLFRGKAQIRAPGLRMLCRAAVSGTAAPRPANQPGIVKFLADQFLPIALLFGMAVGYFFPGGGERAAAAGLQNFTTTGIFIISGLGLRRGESLRALSSWGSVLFGMASILLVTPLTAHLALRLPLHPPELAFGLAVFCCMPTTLSSGVSLTQAVGGNTALALLLTVGSNLVGIFTMPFVLCSVLGAGSAAIQLSPAPLLRSLLKTILAPLLVGVAARSVIPGLAQAVDRRKKVMALLSATLLAMVPWMQISRAVAGNVSVEPQALLAAVAAGVGIHFLFLAFNLIAVHGLGLGSAQGPEAAGIRRAVVLVGSQKTLPIAVTVLNQLSALVAGPIGLAVVPCVVAHLSQILIDSVLVSAWLRRDQLKARRAFRRGLILVTSQKTLSVAALIVPQLVEGGGGIALLVCVSVYLLQLAIDFSIASVWAADA